METLINLILNVIEKTGYLGIFIGMVIESSFIPFPSEIIMIPAGYLVFEGKMNIYMVIFCGILGSLGGALINYYLARIMARPLLVKFGKYFFISAKTIAKTETFFRNHGEISTFTGRLLPGIRQLISIPAGAFGMPMSKFLFFTGLGSGIWLTFLVFFGYFLGENQATIKEYAIYIKIIGILLAFACIAIYFFYKRRNS